MRKTLLYFVPALLLAALAGAAVSPAISYSFVFHEGTPDTYALEFRASASESGLLLCAETNHGIPSGCVDKEGARALLRWLALVVDHSDRITTRRPD